MVEERTDVDPVDPEAQESGLRQVTVAGAPPSEGDRPSGERTSTAPTEPSTDPYIGCIVDDRYSVEKVLGEGGMGVVYRCKHTIIGKKVAMKVLRADLARNQEVTERFLNEAKSASSIGNPHIIDISDFGRLPDGSTYFIMEYLEGMPLSTLVDRGGPVPVERLIHIAEQLAEGLFAAHEAGIVHRDLKPDNIFLIPRAERDFVKILDFGIAKASSTEGKLTQAGQVFGTPHYMSPEQAAGAMIDHRADVYSLGVILYEMASGRVPFDADNFMGILTQHMYKSPAPIRTLVPVPQEIPPGLEAIILRCLSKRPEQRYATMQDLREDLRLASEGKVPTAVAEMMRRSGGFSVPQDYFGSVARLARLPTKSSSKGRSAWPLYAGVAALVAAVAIAVATFTQAPSNEVAAASEARAEAVGTSTQPKAPTPITAAAKKQQVVLAVAPLDARVYRGEEDLGTSPVVVELEEGERVTLRVEKEGYVSTEVELDGTEKKLSIALKKEPAPARVAPRPAPPRAPAPKGPAPGATPSPKRSSTSEIVNPWE